MASVYQTGNVQLPSFKDISRLAKFSAENFEWLLVLLLLVWLIIAPIHTHHITEKIVNSPQRNDFYFVDYFAFDNSSSGRYRYLPMRVMQVTDSSLIVKVGNIPYAKKVSPRVHLKSDRAMQKYFYREELLEISKADLPKLLKDNVIYSAARPNNIYIHGWIVMHESEL